MISATVGVTALAIGGLIPWAMYSIHWGTWWVGDTFGVLITTSLVLSWLAEPRAIWRRRWLSVVLPLVGALALVVVVFAYTPPRNGSACASSSSTRRRPWLIPYKLASATTWGCSIALVSMPVFQR